MGTCNRRMFLRGAGAFALAIPFLPSLVGRARAAAPPLKRFVGLFAPYGTVREHWFPADEKRALEPTGGRGHSMKLSNIEGDLSPVIQRSTFDPLLGKMIFFDGVDAPFGNGHQKTFPFTGYALETPDTLPGMSVDQLIAERAPIYDGEPAFRSLNVGHGPDESGHSISYTTSAGAIVEVPQISSPPALWDYAFKNVASGEDAAQAFEQARARNLSVLDRVLEDYERLKANPRLSRADQLRMEAYLDHLRAFELSVESVQPVTCEPPPRPDEANDGYHERMLAQVDNIIHIVRCGLTNVITFSMETTSATFSHVGATGGHHHSLTHGKDTDPAQVASLEKIDRYHAECVARLVQGLDVLEDFDTGRTFLDNSMVLLTTDMGSVRNHNGLRLPCLLFGGKGYFKQDLFIDFRSEHTVSMEGGEAVERAGISYNGLLVTACHAMGLTPADFEQGQEGIGRYGVPGSFEQPFGTGAAYEQYAYGDRRSPIPEILESP